MKLSTPHRHWLVTAFEPFASRPSNYSAKVLDEMKVLIEQNTETSPFPFQFHFALLPVIYDQCFDALKSEIEKLKKKGVEVEGILALGEGGEEFKIETQGNNLDDVPGFPDNAGVSRTQKKIFEDLAPDADLPLRFPFEAFTRIRTSKNAGNFICNHLIVRMSREFSDQKHPAHFGFIHVPREGMGGMFTADVCAAVIVNGFKKIP